eukprot:NODE_10617_length_1339_cov_12.812706.p1 GENE.NODE_10617_length_1339_cov_12.812706~~NODE_10617_length_1339_cov_12.812706.p1  ORF type:complete len:355 (-),score=113.23 NODE_10617_length_1339_cov_12.812706:165-1229(-)
MAARSGRVPPSSSARNANANVSARAGLPQKQPPQEAGRARGGGTHVQPGPITRAPSKEGNSFDVRMGNEADPGTAAGKAIQALVERGLVVMEANAPHDLLMDAYKQAESLWKEGAFGPALQVYDDYSALDAKLWDGALHDEENTLWIDSAQDAKKEKHTKALQVLINCMVDFGCMIIGDMKEWLGVEADSSGHALLSCYTGNHSHSIHVDNPHGAGKLPDNGVRLTLTYFLNPFWDPVQGNSAGGIDFYLTNPLDMPTSASEAKMANRHRVAPHADTMCAHLSERIAHQVIDTSGKQRWYAISLWLSLGNVREHAVSELSKMMQRGIGSRGNDDAYGGRDAVDGLSDDEDDDIY